MIGMGLLETIPVIVIEKISEMQRQPKYGISGKLNLVWGRELQKTVPGKFGWKAVMPNIKQQVASAFSGDLGIISNLFLNSLCTKQQQKCLATFFGDKLEFDDEILDFVTFYSKSLLVPARRNIDNAGVIEGEQYFRKAECNQCHVETIKTEVDKDFPEYSRQEIHSYTDLLLHDMGGSLAEKVASLQQMAPSGKLLRYGE